MLSGSLLMQDDATPTDTAPEEEDEAVSADGDNAEQDRADTKYREASAAAVAECADDTKGQTCFICMEGIHPETNEGLVALPEPLFLASSSRRRVPRGGSRGRGRGVRGRHEGPDVLHLSWRRR